MIPTAAENEIRRHLNNGDDHLVALVQMQIQYKQRMRSQFFLWIVNNIRILYGLPEWNRGNPLNVS